MANLNGFDANSVEPNDFEPIPAGRYLAVISNSEMKPTKDNSGKYLELQFEVIEGPFKGRQLWTRLNLENSNELAVKIAKGQLSALCRAVGVMKPTDSAQLHNLPLQISVKLKKRTDTDELTNEVKGFSKRPEPAYAGAAANKNSSAPWKR